MVIRDLVDDLLAPLGTVVTPAGLRAGRSAGSLTVHSDGGASPVDLVPGGLELVDLAPGQSAVAEFKFRDTVRLATRGRHFEVEVAGGLGGLLVDLRDVPLAPARTGGSPARPAVRVAGRPVDRGRVMTDLTALLTRRPLVGESGRRHPLRAVARRSPPRRGR